MGKQKATTAVSLRPARPEEAEAISALALRSKAVWGYDKAFMEACRDELRVTADDVRRLGPHIVVAEQTGDSGAELAGYCAVNNLGDRHFEIDALFIDPSAMGNGLGRRLFEHALNLVKRAGGTCLSVQSDPGAEPFYRRMGGEPAGFRASGSVAGRELPLLEFKLSSASA